MRLKADTKEKKLKIKQLNQEIANMKKDNYEIFYKSEFENKKSKINLKNKFNVIISLFILSFCIFSVSLLMLFSSITSGGMFIGTYIVPNSVLTIPFLVGLLFIFIMKDRTVPIIIAAFGIAFIAFSLALSKEVSFLTRPVREYVLISLGIFIGAVSYGILLFFKIHRLKK